MDLHLITTTDNPYSPVTDYDQWLAWDVQHGYCSNNLLARVVISSSDLEDRERFQAQEDGLNIIVEQNLSGVHTKVKYGTYEDPSEADDGGVIADAQDSAA